MSNYSVTCPLSFVRTRIKKLSCFSMRKLTALNSGFYLSITCRFMQINQNGQNFILFCWHKNDKIFLRRWLEIMLTVYLSLGRFFLWQLGSSSLQDIFNASAADRGIERVPGHHKSLILLYNLMENIDMCSIHN